MEHRTPIVLWAQRKDRVFVTIECPNADAPKVNLTDEGVLTFSAMAGTDSTEEKHRYDVKLELLHPVNAKDSKISVGPRHIVVVVQKTEEVSGRPARRPGAPCANAKPRARHSVPTRPERSNHNEKGSPARTRDLILHLDVVAPPGTPPCAPGWEASKEASIGLIRRGRPVPASPSPS